MRASLMCAVFAAILATPLLLHAQAVMPSMKTVEPGTGKAGDILTVIGENLDKNNVAKFYLTNDKKDFECAVVEQAATTVKIKVPGSITPGRMAVMVLTTGKSPKLIVQPVKVTIE